MLIGQVSKASGLSKDTIRFYEKFGLISLGKKERRFNNYKEYSDETLKRLFSIKRLKGFGFTLNEVVELLNMFDSGTATCEKVSHKIDEKVSFLEQKIEELQSVRKQLMAGKRGCKDDTGRLKTPNTLCPVFVR